MTKRKLQIIGITLVLASLVGLVSIPRSITVTINGETQYLNTNAWTVSAALEKDGFILEEADQVEPDASSLLLGVKEIDLELARQVKITIFPTNEEVDLYTANRVPGELLTEAGITLGENDLLLMNDEPVNVEEKLPYQGDYQFVFRKAVAIEVDEAGVKNQIFSSAETLGQAFAENGIQLEMGDRVSPDLETVLNTDLEVQIQRAKPIEIHLKDESIEIQTAAETVAEALAEAGLALQGSDYSLPRSNAPIPEDGQIRIVRVREEFILTQTNIPFSVDYVQSDEVELDQRDVVQAGEFGVEVTRTRVIYEDDQEVSRVEEITWVAKEPKDQLTGLGTKVVVRTMDTPSGPIEYWRAVNVYATSYSPCRLGIENYCSSGTASGLTAQHGVIAVTRAWYNLMVGQRMYVPGYGIGVVGDIGGGVPGKYWIDLAYSDNDYVAWYHNVTAYFLTPVPENIPWILP
ncbi:MAG: hypothetical protein CVU41_06605 [Chloroflexi bacterium HGW-Chloroflexi-3]|nr:MAG: hypothetical protein CVU41_06605 [Chloroflexi bacterium HGW-Chloroflexi-3]